MENNDTWANSHSLMIWLLEQPKLALYFRYGLWQ